MTTIPWQGRGPSHKARLLAGLLLLLPFLVVTLYPTVQDYLRAASLLQRISDSRATGWIANYDVHPVDVRDTNFEFMGKPIPARLYVPRSVTSAPGIVVVHGMHDLGINEPRLVNFARSLAATGFLVMTPQVPGIADYRVQAESADLIGTAAQSFAQQLQVPKVGVLALSFSGGLALVAASDPRYSQSIAWIATVGAHYDLAHVLRFFATGEAIRPDGSVEHLAPHEYGPLIVVYDEPQDFFSPQDAQTAHDAIRLLLSGNDKASEEVGKDDDTCRSGNHAAHLSQAARASCAGAARRNRQAEGTTRGRVSCGSSSVSSHAGSAAAWVRRHGHSADRAALAAT